MQQKPLPPAAVVARPSPAQVESTAREDPQHSRCRSPPRGQLLPRGKGGLDDVLKNAREAQNLFFTLQERRLRAEYRSHQRELKAELDQQRHYRRMLDLAAYQEELVNLYGPTMRDVVADVFFDDGQDPVVALLQAKREAAPTHRSDVAQEERDLSSDPQHQPLRQLWQPTHDLQTLRYDSAAASRDRVSVEREQLHRALAERRSGQRTNY